VLTGLQPPIDIDDIADVVVAALTEEGHSCEMYTITVELLAMG